MTLYEIIVPISTALLGGGMGAYFTFRLGGRKQDQSDFTTLVKEYKELYDVSKQELSFLKKEVDHLRMRFNKKDKEVSELRNQLMIFESSHADVPVPLWLKDVNGTMLFLNQEYESLLLHPVGKTMDDYIGKTDIEVWGKETGDKFLRNDNEVIRKRKPVEFTEIWKGNDCVYEGRVIKYPRFLGKTVIGVGGIILDVKCIENNNK